MEEATIKDFLHVTVVSRYDRVLIKWNLNVEIEQPQKTFTDSFQKTCSNMINNCL